MKNLVFDFDGTLAKTTPYHRLGWEIAIQELGIKKDLNNLLPYEPNLTERFDSYRRIQAGFLEDLEIKSIVSSYFNEEQEVLLTKRLMDLKESLTIKIIFQEKITNTFNNLGGNLLSSLNTLKLNGVSIGIISSTRESLICCLLYKCGILDTFDFIVGEESLTDENGILFDKPDLYAKNVLNQLNRAMDYYIGDNETIDKKFAEICEAKFIYADYNTDFLDLATNFK